MNMQERALGLTALLATCAACDMGSYDLGAPKPTAPLPVTGACTAAPTVLARIAGVLPRTLEIDSTNLYVVATTGGDPAHETLWRVPLGGDAPVAVADGLDHVGGVAVYYGPPLPDAVLWSTGSTGPGGAIWRNDAASGTTAIVSNRTAPGPLIVLGRRVYWGEGLSGGDSGGSIQWAPVAGGDASTLQELTGDEIPRTFDGDHAHLWWTTEDPALGNAATAQIVGVPVPLPFGAPWCVARGAAGLELTDQGIVFSGPAGLSRVGLQEDAGSLALQTIPVMGFVQTIEEDGINLYYVDPSTHALVEVGIGDAGTGRHLADGVDPASAMQADGTCVYWIDATTGAVMMVHS